MHSKEKMSTILLKKDKEFMLLSIFSLLQFRIKKKARFKEQISHILSFSRQHRYWLPFHKQAFIERFVKKS
jgi:hypothetical protein